MQYFKTTTIINGEGEQVATLEDVELTADEVIAVLAAQVDVKEVTPLPKDKKITGGGPAKKKYKTRKVKEEKTAPAAKGRRGGKRTVSDTQIFEVLNLKKTQHTIDEMVKLTGLSKSTVYRITSGSLKPENKPGKNSTTVTEVGERTIDKKEPMLTADQYAEVKDAHNDGMAPDFVSLTLGFDIEQIRKAIKSDNYTQYTARY